VHLAHHRDYFTPDDPDFVRKSGADWSTPKRPLDLLKLLLGDLSGINTIKLIRGKKVAANQAAFARRHRIPRWMRPLYFVALAGLLSLSGQWGNFLLYWVLPLLTVFQVIVRWGALCEHKYNLAGASVADSTPLIVLGWWERALLPNLNFAMHPYHHYFPGVSFSRLPSVHAIFEREGLIDGRHVFRGYAAYLRYIIRPTSPGAPAR
jgi:fatty acid desaturase